MIPNIVHGSGISGALAYAMGQGNDAQTGKRLSLAEGETSRATILGGQNFGFEIATAEDLDLARRLMEFQGLPQNQANKTRKLEKDCLHASLSWGIGQEPSKEEMLEAGQSFLKAIGLEKARAVFIAHDDTDHRHIHVVASRIDPETRRSLRMDYDKFAGQKWAVQWEREHGQERSPEQGAKLAGLIEGIEKRDAQAVLAHVTRDKATFQEWEIGRTLASYGDLSAEDRAAFKTDILGQKNVIGLSDTKGGEVNRFTTTEALAAEMVVRKNALDLSRNQGFGIKETALDKASAKFTLKPEQDAALRHLTADNGIGLLWGQAGTGKSHTFKAVRSVYEQGGKNVIGLSWTNEVVQQMRGDGFKEANTISSELWQIDHGKKAWDKNTVLMVDEAGQLSTEAMAKLLGTAQKSGAKVIMAGDDKQLTSIERGGMFETLREAHGAAILKEVQRVKNVEQRPAWNQMHEGQFLDALKGFDKAGGIHWTNRQSDALKAMATQYSAAVEASPDKRRFMLAYTNADVASLNQQARQIQRDAGKLGVDQSLKAATGTAQFATGDRIQFSGNGRTKKEKDAGLTNGRVGNITEISFTKDHKARVTVDLDVEKGAKPQTVSFIVGEDAKAGEFNSFKLGYAGTVYKSQGRTLDQIFIAHHKGMRAAASYVALTRHREDAQIFAARETVKDLDTMAKGMARTDGKRAATAYQIDQKSAERAELEKAVADWKPTPRDFAERTPQTAREATRAPEAQTAGQAAPAGHVATEGAVQGLEAAAAKVADILDTVSNMALKPIEIIADLFGSSAPRDKFGNVLPPPKQQPPAAPVKKPEPTLESYLAAQRQQEAALQALSRTLNVSDGMTEEELHREQEKQQKQRDRGGGQSL